MFDKKNSKSPLSIIVFVKKIILSRAKTLDDLYQLSKINSIFYDTVYHFINASDLNSTVKKSISSFMSNETSALLNSCYDQTEESIYMRFIELYSNLYRGRENQDDSYTAFLTFLRNHKIIKNAVSKDYINMARSILKFYDEHSLRATYEELGEEGYQLLHPQASAQPTMRFFQSNQLAHDSSGVGELIVFSEENSSKSFNTKLSCVLQ